VKGVLAVCFALLIAVVVSGTDSVVMAEADTALQRADAALRTGDYQAAHKLYETLLSTSRDNAPARAGLLQALYETGAYSEAEKLAAEFITKDPSPEIYLEAGRIESATGELRQAELHLRQCYRQQGAVRVQAARELADLLSACGRRSEARNLWEEIVAEYRAGRLRGSDALGQAAVAAWRLGYAQDAKEIFLDATDDKISGLVSPRSLADFGFLFVQTYNATDAIGVFRDCLKINARYAPALFGTARARMPDSSREAESNARAALAVNPNYVPAINLLAELQMQEEAYGKAEQELNRALAVDPSNLESLSLLAACQQSVGNLSGFAGTEKKVLAINPGCGSFYHTLADNLVMRRKYRETVEQERHAVRLEPDLWAAQAGLGINLLRLGEMVEGREAIERAFRGDPFNVWAYNTLDLLDQMAAFVRTGSEHFVFLMSKEDGPVVAPYATRLAEEAYAGLTARYRFTPEGPIRVELFPDHGGFAVRTLGLPGLGALGVCFGRVIAQDSPRARKAGSFNWGSTLWHEFAHVITLQMTNHNIPRWYSEGISVYEEHRARPGWGDSLTTAFIKAYKEGRLLKVSQLNAGMMNPQYPEQIAFSYYQAALACELIEERFGPDKIRQTLLLFAQGQPSGEVFEKALGWNPPTFDREYARYLDTRLKTLAGRLDFSKSAEPDQKDSREALTATLKSNPDDFFANLRLGALLKEEGSNAAAERYLRRAQEIFPDYTDDGGTYRMLFEIYEKAQRQDEALAQLVLWSGHDGDAVFPLMHAAEIYRSRKDWQAAVRMLDAASFINPYDTDTQKMLGECAAAAGDWQAAAVAYEVLLGLNTPDPVGAHYGLAQAWLALGRQAEARKEILRALEIAPTFGPAQQLLLKLSGRDPR
jgi:tetratricopeptide (TPR) repeat protein